MSEIKEKINQDLKEAMRARDMARVAAFRLILAAVKQKEVDERITLDDQAMLLLLDKLIKQRRESITQFEKAQRDDLIAKEQYELDIIQTYLPTPLSEAEINQLIAQAIEQTEAASIRDMGKVMAILKPQLQGRADMSKVSGLIKTKLN